MRWPWGWGLSAYCGHGGSRRARGAAAHQKDYPGDRRAEPVLQGAGGELETEKKGVVKGKETDLGGSPPLPALSA